MSHIASWPGTATPPFVAPSEFTCELGGEGLAATWIHLGGELDLISAPQLEQVVSTALDGARLVVLDLGRLTFTDVTGLHVMLEADARARRSGRRVTLVHVPARLERLLELIGLTERLAVMGSRSGLAPVQAPATEQPRDAA